MPIKVDIDSRQYKPPTKFPCLMQTRDGSLVVLFWDEKHGTVMKAPKRSNDGCPYETGQNLGSWNINEFTLFYGSITLSNE